LSVACTDSLRAWAVSYLTSSTYDCYVLNTTDGGENWNIQANPAYATMWSISMQDSLNGWIAGYNLFNGLATLWQTQNGGAQWMPHTLNYATDLLAVKAVGQTVLAASDWGLILRSTNNGAVFTADTSGTDNSLWDLALVGADHAWAVGPSGTILRCVIEPSATDDRTLPLAQTYTLSAYPNPFNPISVIELSLPHAQRVRIAVYDVEGRLVKMLADRVIPAGKQQFTFDGSRLSSGIYFARAESGDFAKSLRLVLLK